MVRLVAKDLFLTGFWTLLCSAWAVAIVTDVRSDRPDWVLADVVIPPVGILRGLAVLSR